MKEKNLNNTSEEDRKTIINIIAQSGATVNINVNNNDNNNAIQKWEEKKLSATTIQSMLYDLYHSENPQKAIRITTCGDFLTLRHYFDAENTTRLKSANFCKHPLCPLCAWRYSIEWARKLYPAVKSLQDEGYFLYHIVLTMPNVDNLTTETIKELRAAKAKFFRSVIKPYAYADSVEITISKRGQFHPHMHAICAVEKEIDTSKESIEEYRKKWRKYMPSEYDYTIMAIYPVKNTQHDVSEICKYIFTAKSNKISHAKLYEIANAIHGVKKSNVNAEMSKRIKEASQLSEEEYKKLISELEKYGWTDQHYIWSRKKKHYKSL